MEKPNIDDLAKTLDSTTTSDKLDPRIDMVKDNGQNKAYLILSAEERNKGYVRPYRDSYIHNKCGVLTRMGQSISETYARQPSFYGSTFCCGCRTHFPVGEFKWDKSQDIVGS